jgi:ferrous iron transport protein B
MNMSPGSAIARRPAVALAPDIAAAAQTARAPVVALVGRPNVGKSTFFADISGKFAETANAPGTTVGIARREVDIDGRRAVLIDLPGTLALDDRSDGLAHFWQLLLEARPDALLVVVDAGDLAGHLPLVLACRDLGLPIVVAANLSDEAAVHGVQLDLGRLSQLLAVPVFGTVGRRGRGTREAAVAAVERARAFRAGRHTAVPAVPYSPIATMAANRLARSVVSDEPPAGIDERLVEAVRAGVLPPIGAASLAGAAALDAERWDIAARWAAQVERRTAVSQPLADRLGRLATSPWPGLPLFAAVTIGTLLATMIVGTAVATLLSDAWSTLVSPPLTSAIETLVPLPLLAQSALWALDSGLLAMLMIGIPFVLCFYLILAALEDSGYLATTAVLTDRIFNSLGLPGRAVIPVFAATGCNVPAIYATRVFDTRRERLLASLLIVMTPCSARSAVVIAALAPFAGPAAALAAFGVILLVTIGTGVAANALVPGRQSPAVLELPPLRVPVASQVAGKAWFRFRSFMRTAAPVMVVGSFVLGLAYESGAIGPVESALAPITVGLLGLPAVAGVALVLAFLRKELALQLLVVLAVAQLGQGAADLGSFMTSGQLFVFAVVTAISIPCIATVASLLDEFGWRPTLAIGATVLVIAIGVGTVLAQLII